jgi:hypothetical protein
MVRVALNSLTMVKVKFSKMIILEDVFLTSYLIMIALT